MIKIPDLLKYGMAVLAIWNFFVSSFSLFLFIYELFLKDREKGQTSLLHELQLLRNCESSLGSKGTKIV